MSTARTARWLLLLMVLGLGAVCGEAADVVKLSTNYYKVLGSTPHEVRRSINEQKPWKDKAAMDAQTDWSVRCKYFVSSEPSAGWVVSVAVETVIVITLPAWEVPPRTPKEYTERWAKYFAALLRHEVGHADNALAAAAEVRRQVSAIRGGSSRAELNRRINDTINRVLSEFREEDKLYDKETHHGVAQGAKFP